MSSRIVFDLLQRRIIQVVLCQFHTVFAMPQRLRHLTEGGTGREVLLSQLVVIPLRKGAPQIVGRDAPIPFRAMLPAAFIAKILAVPGEQPMPPGQAFLQGVGYAAVGETP